MTIQHGRRNRGGGGQGGGQGAIAPPPYFANQKNQDYKNNDIYISV